MSQTVVIALDSSDLSARAMPFARTAAHLWRGRMVLVHATVHSGRGGACSVEGQLSQLVSALRSEGINADAMLRAEPPGAGYCRRGQGRTCRPDCHGEPSKARLQSLVARQRD